MKPVPRRGKEEEVKEIRRKGKTPKEGEGKPEGKGGKGGPDGNIWSRAGKEWGNERERRKEIREK